MCTEPGNDPAEALQYAGAFEEGLRRHKRIVQPSTPMKIGEEPVHVVSSQSYRK